MQKKDMKILWEMIRYADAEIVSYKINAYSCTSIFSIQCIYKMYTDTLQYKELQFNTTFSKCNIYVFIVQYNTGY